MASEYKDTFRGTAGYYARYREGYPDEFFNMVKRKFALSKSDRVLDLGCGTGQIAIPISPFVEEVIAMDPEPEMIEEGKQQAEKVDSGNIVWIEGGSEDLPRIKESLGSFKLVTMGTSFHWMDREKTLGILYEMINPGGGISIAWDTNIWTNESIEWRSAALGVIRKWLGEERRAGSGTFNVASIQHEIFVAGSSFGNMEIWKLHWTRESTLDEVVGHLYSTSMANPYILGDNEKAFEEDLRETLLKINPSGIFTSEGDVEAILAWK